MYKLNVFCLILQSLPTRERGLKSVYGKIWLMVIKVAPHAGAWIEIYIIFVSVGSLSVAPHAGAWIEIRESLSIVAGITVAPHAGAWIEIML